MTLCACRDDDDACRCNVLAVEGTTVANESDGVCAYEPLIIWPGRPGPVQEQSGEGLPDADVCDCDCDRDCDGDSDLVAVVAFDTGDGGPSCR